MKKAWAALSTERRNPRSRDLDRLSTVAVVRLLLDEDRRALVAAARCAAAVARASTLLARAIESGGRAVLVGAGTSGRLGVLEAAECPPTFGLGPRQIEGVMAGGRSAVFRSREGAEDDEAAGVRIGARLRPRDVLIGISASSVTPFARGALSAARRRGAATVLVTCARAVPHQAQADVVVRADTGPEVLTGSTRLKAGSATKAILNAMTTAAMVRLGKTYGNRMVDMKRTSAKLRDRQRRLVMELGAVDAARASSLLARTKGEAKTAIVMARLGLSAKDARVRLSAARGHLRAVIG